LTISLLLTFVGVFADRGGNSSFGDLTPEKKKSWIAGHVELLEQCQKMIGAENILIANNADQVYFLLFSSHIFHIY